MTTTGPVTVPTPAPDEYADFYEGYVQAVAGQAVGEVLQSQVTALVAMAAGLSDEAARFRYAPDRWSVKQVLGHVADSERVFAYRALRIARNDRTPLPGFDQDLFVAAAGFDERSIDDLLDELRTVRVATMALVRSVRPEWWERRGDANGFEISLRAVVHVIAGHFAHHQRILTDRYGLGGG